MEPVGEQGKFDWETNQTRWVTFDEAEKLINQSTTKTGRERDLQILRALQDHLNAPKYSKYQTAEQMVAEDTQRSDRFWAKNEHLVKSTEMVGDKLRTPTKVAESAYKFSKYIMQDKDFFSPMEQAANLAKAQKMKGKDWVNVILKSPGVKREELEDTGVLEYLEKEADTTLSKADLVDFIRDQSIRVAEHELEGGESISDYDVEREMEYQTESYMEEYQEPYSFELITRDVTDPDNLDLFGQPSFLRRETFWQIYENEDRFYPPAGKVEYDTREYNPDDPEGEDIADEVKDMNRDDEEQTRQDYYDSLDPTEIRDQMRDDMGGGDAEHESYTIPGDADTYREYLYALPDTYRNRNYTGGHYGSVKNVFAHARIKERRLFIDGKRYDVYHVEEVQSDWHQRAANQGYDRPLTAEDIKRKAELESVRDQRATEANDLKDQLVVEGDRLPNSLVRSAVNVTVNRVGYDRTDNLRVLLARSDLALGNDLGVAFFPSGSGIVGIGAAPATEFEDAGTEDPGIAEFVHVADEEGQGVAAAHRQS